MESSKTQSNQQANQSTDAIVDGDALVATVIDSDDVSEYVQMINHLPESNQINRVMAIKKAIDSGTYCVDNHLDAVVDALLPNDPTLSGTPALF